MTLEKTIQSLQENEPLSVEACEKAFDTLIETENEESGKTFLKLLSEKQETVEELEGLAKVLRSKMEKVALKESLLEIGSFQGSSFLTTGVALLAVGCGEKIAQWGSVDILEHFGIPINETPLESFGRAKIALLHPSNYHLAMKKLEMLLEGAPPAPLFQLVQPLLNPALPDYLFLHVKEKKHLELYPKVLQKLCIKRAMVVQNAHMDILSPIEPSAATFVTPDEIIEMAIDPEKLGFQKSSSEALAEEEMDQKVVQALSEHVGLLSDALILNAGVALFVTKRAPSIESGIAFAAHAHASGRGLSALERLRKS